MTNNRIIMTIFDEHFEKHESVSLFLQNEPRKFRIAKRISIPHRRAFNARLRRGAIAYLFARFSQEMFARV